MSRKCILITVLIAILADGVRNREFDTGGANLYFSALRRFADSLAGA